MENFKPVKNEHGNVIGSACGLIFPLLLFFLLFNSFNAKSQVQVNKTTRILLMLDCSGSMHGFIGGSKVEKMDVAKKLLLRMVDSLSRIPDVELALHTYGDQHYGRDCKDSRLAVFFAPGNADKIKKEVKAVEAKGITPIAYSLSMAQNEFPAGKGNNYIVLITDGAEECQGDPCAVSVNLQAKGIFLKPFIIGIGLLDNEVQSLRCVGRVYNTKTENDLSEVLNLVVSQALNNTTAQVNLNNSKGLPKETNVNMTFYNSKTHEVVCNYYHTFNKAGLPDTFKLDPVYKYDLQVNTTPQIIKKNIELKSAQHNIINVDASQGNLQINCKSPTVKCLVREDHGTEIIFVQDVNSIHRYLSGVYDVEALTLPKTIFKDTKISENQTNKIDIAQPGTVDMNYKKEVTGAIFVVREGGELEWVIDLAGISHFTLQPGKYRVVYRPVNSIQTEESITKEFIITSALKTTVEINR